METAPSAPSKKSGCLNALLVVIILLLVAILASMWWMKRNLYASEFKPVALAAEEQALLDYKVNRLDPSMAVYGGMSEELPERYREEASARRITLSERELNALLAKDESYARRVFIDLSPDLVSIKFLAPMPPDAPMFGGKTLRLSMGMSLAYTNGQPSVILRGISLGGIPLPSAWWGDVKNKDLVETFGQAGGFWDIFSRGVDHLEVSDERLIFHLRD